MPRWSALGEEGLLRRIRRHFPSPARDVLVPSGDDAALIRLTSRDDLVLSTDQLVEGIHFLRSTHPPDLLGARALTVNLSDLASMGAKPRWFLMSLFLPEDLPAAYREGILKGMAREARRRRLSLVGGNLSRSPVLTLDVCMAGTLPKGRRPILRGGGRPGDALYVTGSLGASALGLELIRAGWRWQGRRRRGASAGETAAAIRLLRAHLAPSPDYSLAETLSRHRIASAAIDLSDGLSTDLWRLCRASRVGARVAAEALPLDPAAVRLVGAKRALELALNGGEDYQLLFAVPPTRESLLARLAPLRSRRIGALVPPGQGVRVEIAGRLRLLPPRGFDHLRHPGR